MTTLKMKDIKKMSDKDREKKMKELKMELTKSRSGNSKTGSKTKEIKKIIARMLTLNKLTEDTSSKEIENHK
jgi:ribosomal protein L29